ncbi:uncharacterized protein FIBRA_08797 [Fibroporia radiculosa]|uniref:Uncharacterized protein n=1 Tax=Fibroporia radiculosa TaxID=599839 RepID=J4H5D0_9APHY|nr:uncharacterized protein FIBRA_08797 [Fibroporia radiculosa]CCM06524.1 predicted protein [Fibroporia radiculosa]
MPAECNNRTRTNNATQSTPRCPLAPSRHNNSPTTGVQRVPTPYPSHLQALEEWFTAGIIEMPTPVCPILSFPSQSNSEDSSIEFLSEGGFWYPFAPLPSITHRPFLIPGLLDSSNSNAIVLHQFPGPLEISHNTSEATTGSYHLVPVQVFPPSLSTNILSSQNPDSPVAAFTDSPSMPPLASDVSNNDSINHPHNLQLLANVSEYVTAMEGYSSDPQEFLVYSDDIIQQPSNDITRAWRSIPFDTSTPVQDIEPLERILPHFPGAYANFIT